MMLEIMLKISTIFVMMLIGYIAGKANFMKCDGQKHLIDMLLNINIPCMLFSSIACGQTMGNSLGVTLKMLCYSAMYFAAATVAAELLVRAVRVKGSEAAGVYKIIFTSINAGFIGLPVAKILFGSTMMYFMALHNIVMNLYMYSAGAFYLADSSERGLRGVKQMLRKMLNPCMMGAALGIVFLLAGIPVPEYAETILEPIGDAAVPVAMIVAGLQLADGKLSDCFADKKLVFFTATAMLLWPILVLQLVKYLPIFSDAKMVLALGAALPPATTISALAADAGKDYKLAADGLVIATLFSIAAIPIVAMLAY